MVDAIPYQYKRSLDRMTPPDVSIDPVNDDLMIALMSTAYIPNQEGDEDWSDISSAEASGEGYTAGGQALNNVAKVTTGELKIVYVADNPSWGPGINITSRYAVVYVNNHPNKALVSFIDFGENKTASGGTFNINLSADGFLIFKLAEKT